MRDYVGDIFRLLRPRVVIGLLHLKLRLLHIWPVLKSAGFHGFGCGEIGICIADRRNPELRVYVPAHQIAQIFARRRDPVARIADGIL